MIVKIAFQGIIVVPSRDTYRRHIPLAECWFAFASSTAKWAFSDVRRCKPMLYLRWRSHQLFFFFGSFLAMISASSSVICLSTFAPLLGSLPCNVACKRDCISDVLASFRPLGGNSARAEDGFWRTWCFACQVLETRGRWGNWIGQNKKAVGSMK